MFVILIVRGLHFVLSPNGYELDDYYRLYVTIYFPSSIEENIDLNMWLLTIQILNNLILEHIKFWNIINYFDAFKNKTNITLTRRPFIILHWFYCKL
jgi:hypothetical protein